MTDRCAAARLRGLVGVLPEEVGLYGDGLKQRLALARAAFDREELVTRWR